MRHIGCACFFVQRLNADRMFQFAKVPVHDNPSEFPRALSTSMQASCIGGAITQNGTHWESDRSKPSPPTATMGPAQVFSVFCRVDGLLFLCRVVSLHVVSCRVLSCRVVSLVFSLPLSLSLTNIALSLSLSLLLLLLLRLQASFCSSLNFRE